MTLASRKLAVVVIVGIILLLANLVFVAQWLAEAGVVGVAQAIWSDYLTPTAITITIVLLILLTGPARLGSRCRVCGHSIKWNARYCSECGSRT